MGDSTCLLQQQQQPQQPFSYTSCQTVQGNAIHALSQSVSFGRFVSDSLSWDKWSTFSHNKYVEEASKFSRPGSVAEKKAFFEAHYRTLAARKAASLLEQQANAAAADLQESENGNPNLTTQNDLQMVATNPYLEVDKQVSLKEFNTGATSFAAVRSYSSLAENGETEASDLEQVDAFNKNQFVVEGSEETESLGREMEQPLLKDSVSGKEEPALTSKKKLSVSSPKHKEGSKLQASPAKTKLRVHFKREKSATPTSKAMDRKRTSPKSSCKAMTFTPIRELNRITSKIMSNFNSPRAASTSKASRDCFTPLRTTNTVPEHKGPKYCLVTPQQANRRPTTNPMSSDSKLVHPRWHFVPSDCSKFTSDKKTKFKSPSISTTPFSFRTEERAARRKKKLEEKFNANQQQQEQLQATLKDKEESEIKKIRQALCFKARPLPKFYKERVSLKAEKVLASHSQTRSTKSDMSNAHCNHYYQTSLKFSKKNNSFKSTRNKYNEQPASCENDPPNIQISK